MKTKILLTILAFLLGFFVRDIFDGAKIAGYGFYKVIKLDFTKDGYNPMRDIKFKEVGE